MTPDIQDTTSFTHYSHYLLFGLIGVDAVDVNEICPNQTLVRVKNYFTIEDALFTITTAGLYTPKSTKIWCETPRDQGDSEEIAL